MRAVGALDTLQQDYFTQEHSVVVLRHDTLFTELLLSLSCLTAFPPAPPTTH